MFSKTLLISLALGVLSVNALKFAREPAEYYDLDPNWLKREPEPLGDVRTKSKPKPDTSDESKGPALFGREPEPEPLDYVRRTKRAAISRPTKPGPSMPHQPMPRAVAYAREPEDGVWDWTRGVFMPFP